MLYQTFYTVVDTNNYPVYTMLGMDGYFTRCEKVSDIMQLKYEEAAEYVDKNDRIRKTQPDRISIKIARVVVKIENII